MGMYASRENLTTGELLSGRRWLYAAYRPHDGVDKDMDGQKSLTRQEMKDECDINLLLKRYRDHGVPPAMRVGEPRYLDCSEVPDFREAMDIVINAEQAFMQLPADVRKQLDNDPAKFLVFAQDPENLEQMRKWGLAPPEKAPDAPMRVEVVNPPPGEPAAPPAAK